MLLAAFFLITVPAIVGVEIVGRHKLCIVVLARRLANRLKPLFLTHRALSEPLSRLGTGGGIFEHDLPVMYVGWLGGVFDKRLAAELAHLLVIALVNAGGLNCCVLAPEVVGLVTVAIFNLAAKHTAVLKDSVLAVLATDY